ALVTALPPLAARRFRGERGAGPAGLVAGRITGGERVNSVPARCTVEFDLRLPPGAAIPTEESLTGLARETLMLQAGVGNAGVGVTATARVTMAGPPSATTAAAPLWRRVRRWTAAPGPAADGPTVDGPTVDGPTADGLTAGGPAAGSRGDPVYLGPTDAGALRRLGVPTVVCGPGDIRLAHAVDERVRTAELVRAAELYGSLLARRPR
ncbi:MAG TPA: peptidase dimerization domain-containing protein, partial [Pseudonocardiaceae bacterium]